VKEKITSTIVYFYHLHVMRYLFVGATSLLLDVTILVILHGKLGVTLAVATSIAYWCSIIYNFSLNRQWTFSAGENKKLHQHLAGYSILLGFNYLFTLLFVSFFSHYINYAIAKIIAVAIQTMWTYPMYKFVIFSKPKLESTTSDIVVAISKA